MPIPDYQTIMLPLLKLHQDGADHAAHDLLEALTTHFQLTPEEQREMLPSGKQARFKNRVGWAGTYLRKAGLLQSPARGHSRITERGKQVLADKLERIDVDYLRQFPEFIEFRQKRRTDERVDDQSPSSSESQDTPIERLEASFKEINDELVRELLERVKECSWQFFEQLVIDLLLAMGYGGSREDAGRAFQTSGDEGIDGIIKEDRLGLDLIYVQAKRWQGQVGRPVVQGFAGSLVGKGASRGVLMTTSTFSPTAREYVRSLNAMNVILVDGVELAQLMLEHNVGVSEVSRYVIKRVDTDYFEGE